MHSCIYLYIRKYDRLSLYNVDCMYVFIAEDLILEKQLASFSLEKTISHSEHPLISCSFCERLKTCSLFPIHFGMSVVAAIVENMLRQ